MPGLKEGESALLDSQALEAAWVRCQAEVEEEARNAGRERKRASMEAGEVRAATWSKVLLSRRVFVK